MNWYEHLPNQCPPENATCMTELTFFRIVRNYPADEIDFLSHRALYPEKKFNVDECQAMSLSVFTCIDECRSLMKLPAYKDKDCFIAEIQLIEGDGVVMHTPNNRMTHHSWWRTRNFTVDKIIRLH